MTIVYFGNDWFAENKTSSHHIARRLSKRYPLLYVEVPGLRAPKADARDIRKIFRKISNSFQPPRQIDQQMWHMTVPQIPFRNMPLVATANRTFGTQLVKAAMRAIGFERPLLWFTVPHPGHFVGQLGDEFSVYYCIDDYSALPDVDNRQVAKLDADLTKRADLLFVSSSTLLESKKSLHPDVIYSPHGVDTELFGRAQAQLAPAEGTRGLTHPIIGLHGLIDERMDLDMVASIARARPQWTLLLIGRIAANVSALQSLPNVVFAGMVPYETLPDWARAYDVSIMAYKRGPFAENANPLKLREYLACGKPVVSTPMPAVEPFRQHVLIASTTDEFVACIDQALATDSAQATRARMAAIEHMSWDARVAEVAALVEERWTRKAGAPVGSFQTI
jgi:glycosyltransferase involved in cell wall biosynthesis